MGKQIQLLCFLLFTIVSLGQNITLEGVVTDATTGETLPGVNVVVKGTVNGVETDFDGKYTLKNVPPKSVIVFSYIGYATQEKSVPSSRTLNVQLTESSQKLEEVVIVGYGTQKVTKVTGAMSTVKTKSIEQLKPVRAEEALQSQASGVNVITAGSPGAAPAISIRGVVSNSGSSPLVVIDGLQATISDLNAINPSDIASINLLKDAAVTAIYGVRGGNGVIVVTTKSGKDGKTTFNFDTYYGVQEVTRTIPVLNATEYAAIINEASVNSGGDLIFTDLSNLGQGTNWQDEVIKTAAIKSYNFSASGGGEFGKYYLSAGFLGQDGVVSGGDKSYFDRFNMVANTTFDVSKKVKLVLNTNYANIKSKSLSENNITSVLSNALNFDPTVAPYDANGAFGISNAIKQEIINPLAQIDNTYNIGNTNKLFGKVELQYEVLPKLKFTSRLAYNYADITGKSFDPYKYYGVGHNQTNANEDLSPIVFVDPDTGETTSTENRVSESRTNFFNYTLELFTNYQFNIGEDHSFDTVLGFSILRDRGENITANAVGVPFNSWDFADVGSALGDAASQTSSSWQYIKRNLSYFGRVNYDYQDKYIASIIARVDGSTAFGENNKFGFFPSASLAWVISKEDFFKSTVVNFLKLKASYGIVGNENIPNQFSSITTFPKYTFDGTIYTGSALGSIPNADITWEKQKQLNFGFESRLFNSLSIDVDYYRKKVSDLLFAPDTPPTLGTIPAPLANIGSSETDGIDISISYNDNFGEDFKFNTSLNFTTVSSKVTEVNNSSKKQFGASYGIPASNITVFEEGYTPWYFYGYKTDGIFQNQDEVDAHATQTGAQPGDIRFVDVNGDGVINDADRTEIGNPLPEFTLGWNVGFDYKNFDFSMQTYASYGNDVYRAYERNLNYTNRFASALDRWTGPGTSNSEPRVTFVDTNNNRRASDRYIEDGSYFRIKNIALGYSLPEEAIKSSGLSQVRIYAQIKNALTLTKYSGYDPEITSGSFADTGIDRGTYPIPRIWSFGINVKF